MDFRAVNREIRLLSALITHLGLLPARKWPETLESPLVFAAFTTLVQRSPLDRATMMSS